MWSAIKHQAAGADRAAKRARGIGEHEDLDPEPPERAHRHAMGVERKGLIGVGAA